MWESIAQILTSDNALQTLIAILLIVIVVILLIRAGAIKIKTDHIQIGYINASEKERAILREQIDWAHTYITGLEGKIRQVTPELRYGGYFTKYILELVYDEVVKWITFNHISLDEAYVQAKTTKLISLVYAQNVQKEFMEPEFKTRMERWVREVIEQLIETRELYSKGTKH